MYVYLIFFSLLWWVILTSAQDYNLQLIDFYMNQFLMECYNRERFNIYYWRDCHNQLGDWYALNFATKYKPPIPNPTTDIIYPSASLKYIPPAVTQIPGTLPPPPLITQTYPKSSAPSGIATHAPSPAPTPHTSHVQQTTEPSTEQQNTTSLPPSLTSDSTTDPLSPSPTDTGIMSEETNKTTADESSVSLSQESATPIASSVHIWPTATTTTVTATADQGGDTSNVPFVPGFDYLTFNSARAQPVNSYIIPLLLLLILFKYI